MYNEFMQAAIDEAKRAAKMGEVPVGAVIVKDNKIISTGHNLCERENNPLLHAEIVAIDGAIKTLSGSRLEECDLYVTLEPCAMCCGAISHARLKRVYFGAYDKTGGCAVSNLACFSADSPLWHVECYCGIMEEECSKLLTEFFKDLRHDKINNSK